MTNLRNEITRFQQRFDESFYEAWERFNDLLRACPHHGFSMLHQLNTFYNALNVNDQDSLNSAAGGNFLDKMPRECLKIICLKIIESKSKVRQSRAKAVVTKVGTSSSTPSISFDVAELKDMVKALLLDKKNQSPAPTPSTTPALFKAVEPNYVTCGGAHVYQNCPATHENAYRDNIQEYVSQATATNYNQGNTGFRPQMVANQIRPLDFPPHQNNQNNFNRGNNFNQNRGGNFNQSNFNPSSFNQGQLNRRQPRSKYAEQVPKHSKSVLKSAKLNGHFVSANTASSSRLGTLPGNTVTNPKEELKGITTQSGVAYQGPETPSPSKQETNVTKDQVQTPSSLNTAPVQPLVIQSESQASVSEPVVAPVSTLMPNSKPSIPYPSRRDNEKRRDQANEQIEKFYEIFKEMSFEISFTDALILMPKFASTLKALIGNKEKLSEMARTTMNKHCSAVILNKLPRKLGLSLPELTPTCTTLELPDRSVSKPIGIAKDVSFKVGVFHIPSDFVVIDFEPDHRVPLILGSVTPTPQNDPIVFATSPTLTPFGDSDFLLFEEADAFLSLEDDPDSSKINLFYYDPEGDILLLEAILNSEPSPPLPNQEQNLPSFKEELKAYEAQTIKSSFDEPPEVELKDLPHHLEYAFLEGDNKLSVIIAKELRSEEKTALIKSLGQPGTLCTQKGWFHCGRAPSLPNHEQSVPSFTNELKACEAKMIKSSVDEPREVELKDLPPHLEYAFLEGDNKLPVIIAKEVGEEEKAALIKVLKSHKRAIAWKLSDIQGINLEFCTHKILIEEDYKPSVQHQRRVNPKIHDVIKKEVEKLLDAGLIYPISDSPWVSPVHCVPKKGGFTVVKNEENELIPTRLVTGWR
nr:reverse transcriptase domain-containing protein [Tanacetum cinerariifolium]